MTTYNNGKQKIEFNSGSLPSTISNLWAEIKARRVILSSREGTTWINLPLWVVIVLTFITTEVVVAFLLVALIRQGKVKLVRTENTSEKRAEPESELV